MKTQQLIKIIPVVIFAVALLTSSPAAADGEMIYNMACKMCHGSGMMGAPKVGDTVAWAYLTDKGLDTLYDNSINGFKEMPPKGGKESLSDEDIRSAVDYMVEHSR